MSARPPEPGDEPEAVDQVMLSVLSNRGRDATVLTAEQERLLDDWVAGRLAAPEAERAAALASRNTLAAERVLERRLQQAAGQGPAVPESLRARVLGAAAAPRTSAVASWWHSLRRRQWLAIAGAVALASIVVVVGGPVLQRAIVGDAPVQGAPVQVAMVTIGDRSALFEPSDVRMRGAPPQPASPDQRFRDVEMPTGVLRDVVAGAGRPVQGDLRRQLEPYLPNAAGSGRPLKLIVDAGLRQSLDVGAGPDRLVRIYDLNDPRAADIARMLNAAPDGGLAYLLTTKP